MKLTDQEWKTLLGVPWSDHKDGHKVVALLEALKQSPEGKITTNNYGYARQRGQSLLAYLKLPYRLKTRFQKRSEKNTGGAKPAVYEIVRLSEPADPSSP